MTKEIANEQTSDLEKTELEGEKSQESLPGDSPQGKDSPQAVGPGSPEETEETWDPREVTEKLAILEKELEALQYARKFQENAAWLQKTLTQEKQILKRIKTLKKSLK
jgi:hypothetical protein